MHEMTEDINFITEWPPPETKQTENDGNNSMQTKTNSDSDHSDGDKNRPNKKARLSSNENGAQSNHRSNEDFADVALASWWRRSGSRLYRGSIRLPDSSCPSTIMNFLSRTEQGNNFLRKHVANMARKIRICKEPMEIAKISAAMGTVWERLGEYKMAENCLKKSLKLFPGSKENGWILERVRRQMFAMQKQAEMLPKIPITLDFPKSTDVLRIDAANLTVEEFHKLYCSQSTPVIITGVSDITRTHWDLSHIGQIAGDKIVIPKRYVHQSVEWAKLENCCEITVSELLKTLDDPGASRYLFDWSLPLHCPQLAAEINIPKYFKNNYIQETQDGSMYKDSWPSLFISPADVNSKLHVDTNGTHFWMALIQGRKRWTVFQPDDTPCLYPKYHSSLDPVFEVDVQNMNLESHPLLSATHPQTFDLLPGDILFVPAGCPHEVVNMEISVAISGNFINNTNFGTALKELEANSLVDERAEDLLKQLKCIHVDGLQ